MPSAQEIIDKFELIAHPEGGYFRETYRSGAEPMQSKGMTDPQGRSFKSTHTAGLAGGERNEMTSIYWMARGDDEVSHLWMGLNTSPHVHYYQSGDPFKYILFYEDGTVEEFVMGPDPTKGHVMQMVVPTGTYKCGTLMKKESGAYFLCGEGVSPGFDFRDFKFINFAELSARIGKVKANEYRPFLKDDPESNFDSFYDSPSQPVQTASLLPGDKHGYQQNVVLAAGFFAMLAVFFMKQKP